MSLVLFVHIGIFSFLLGAQIIRRSFLDAWARRLFWLAIAITVLLLLYQSRQQFVAWAIAPAPARYLVPPYENIGYFLNYIFYRIADC